MEYILSFLDQLQKVKSNIKMFLVLFNVFSLWYFVLYFPIVVEDYDDALSSNSYSSRQSMTSLQGYEIEGSDKACKDSTFKSSDLQVGG